MSNEYKSMTKTFVVGDKLKSFISNNNVIGISQLESMVDSSKSLDSVPGYEIYVGQGVCEMQMKKLQEKVLNKKLESIYKIVMPEFYKKSTRSQTHKHKNENIMISEPVKLSVSQYKCHLMLNDNCAEMSDHITGQHLQGMVVIEAARQMVLAVSEMYLISNSSNVKANFLTNSINAEFYKFIFPLQVEMTCEILSMKNRVANNFTSNYVISFIQNGELCARLICRSSVLDSDYIEEKETYLANECIRTHLNFGVAMQL